MHEFVLSGAPAKRELGVRTLDIAKRLLDYGFHPPTIYFPLLVDEALMVEPTETETRESLDRLADAFDAILAEAEEDAEILPPGSLHDAGPPPRRGRREPQTVLRQPLSGRSAPRPPDSSRWRRAAPSAGRGPGDERVAGAVARGLSCLARASAAARPVSAVRPERIGERAPARRARRGARSRRRPRRDHGAPRAGSPNRAGRGAAAPRDRSERAAADDDCYCRNCLTLIATIESSSWLGLQSA